jgi:hypothetical protein
MNEEGVVYLLTTANRLDPRNTLDPEKVSVWLQFLKMHAPSMDVEWAVEWVLRRYGGDGGSIEPNEIIRAWNEHSAERYWASVQQSAPTMQVEASPGARDEQVRKMRQIIASVGGKV